jgi:hypothetical protein
MGSSFFLSANATFDALGGYWTGGSWEPMWRLKYNIENVGTTEAELSVHRGRDNWDSVGNGTSYYDSGLSAGDDWTINAHYWNYGLWEESNDVAIAANTYDNAGTVKLKVTAFIDIDDDGVVDASEDQADRTITYLDPRLTTTNTTITSLTTGDNWAEAGVSFGNTDINLEQVAQSAAWGWDEEGYNSEAYSETSALGVAWSYNNDTCYFTGYDDYSESNTFDYCDDNWDDVYYDSDLKKIIFPYYFNDVDAGVYTAQAYFWDESSDNDEWVKIGSRAQGIAVPNTVSTVGRIHGDVNNNVAVNDNDDTIVRSGTTTIAYTSKLTNSDGDPVAAGIKATLYLGDDDLQVGSSVKVGDKTLIANGDELEIPLVTDSAGKVHFTATVTGDVDDSFYYYIYSQGVYSSTDYTYFEDTDYSVYPRAASAYWNDRWVAVGGTLNVTYDVLDQWGVAPADGYRLNITRSTNVSRDTAASFNYTPAVNKGVATVAIKDNGAGFGSDWIYAQLEKPVTGGYSDDDLDGYGFYLTYTDASLITPTAVTVEAQGDEDNDYAFSWYNDYNWYDFPYNNGDLVALTDLSEFKPYNSDIDNMYNWVYDQDGNIWEGDGYVGVYGQVTGANGIVGGVEVTVSLPGAVLYQSDWGYVRAVKDSITVLTDNEGYYYVGIFGDHSGKQTVTVTSGGKTDTVDLTFASADPATVTLVANGGSATAQSGRSVALAATVLDANGYPVPGVEVTFAATGGVGSLSSVTADTDSKGVATVSYLTSVADTGSVDFTASTTELTSAKSTVTFARSTGYVVNNKKNVAVAKWSNAKGQSILVTVDGYRRYLQVETADAANSFSKKLKKGKHVINLYIGGVLVDSMKWTVKK